VLNESFGVAKAAGLVGFLVLGDLRLTILVMGQN
jgi:hypothetical protein